jgi:uncharacterized coiled-coil protein SlyX
LEAPPSRPGFRQYARRFFEALLKLVAWVIILGVIGGGLYFGLPLLYQRYILPVQENTVELRQLREQQIQSEQTIADLQTRLTDMEAQQAQQAESLTSLDGRVAYIEKEIDAHTETLGALEKMQETLQTQNDAASTELKHQVNLVKSMELLSRARLYMYQSNFGLAEQDVQSARDLLVMIRPDAEDTFAVDLDAVILRLDLILSNLPNFPVAASNDLDIAWQILLGRTPQPQPTISTTPTPGITPTLTPQPTVSPTATP